MNDNFKNELNQPFLNGGKKNKKWAVHEQRTNEMKKVATSGLSIIWTI